MQQIVLMVRWPVLITLAATGWLCVYMNRCGDEMAKKTVTDILSVEVPFDG